MVITVNDSSVNCPIFWEEVDTGTYQRIKSIKEPTLLKVFGVLINMDFDEVAKSQSEDLEVALYQCASFVFNQEEYFKKKETPKSIKIRGVHVMLPSKLENMTLEQTLFMRTKMAKEGAVLEEFIALACAVYLQPLVTQTPFSTDEAMALKDEIERLPIEITYPVGFFFLNRLNSYGKSGMFLLLRVQLMRLMRRLLNKPR